jgi:AraC family transcriptional regulator
MKSSPADASNVLTAIEYIEENLRLPITVDDVCRQLPLSPWQFQRQFRYLVGDSIGSYIRGRRLSEAFSALLQPQSPRLIDLAFELQFNSHEAFTRSFKACFGIVPSQARDHAGLYQLKRKPRLDKGAMATIWDALPSEPEAAHFTAREYIGLVRDVASPFSMSDQFESETAAVWRDFRISSKGAIHSAWSSQPAFGIALNTKEQLIAPTMAYLACKPAEDFAMIPEGLTSFRLEESKYYVFTISAPPSKVHTLVDYIYGIWLPNSGHERARGYDFEAFDFSKLDTSGLLVYSYHLPIN